MTTTDTTTAAAVAPAPRIPLWGRVGTSVADGTMTAAEAIQSGGLDWNVVLEPAYMKRNDSMKRVKEQYFVVRDDTDQVMGKVSERYQIFQNREAFEFCDNLVDSGEAKYAQVGTGRKSRVVFLTCKMPEQVLIGGEDAVDLYIILSTSHDGSRALNVNVSPLRLACTNALHLLPKNSVQSWSMPHTKSAKGKLEEARESLKLTWKYAEEFKATAEKLMTVTISDDEFTAIMERAFPARPSTDDTIQSILGVYRGSDTNGYQGTGWGAVNAVTEWFDHKREVRSAEASLFGGLSGYAFKTTNKVTDLLLSR